MHISLIAEAAKKIAEASGNASRNYITSINTESVLKQIFKIQNC